MTVEANPHRRPRAEALRSNLPMIFEDSVGHAEAFMSVGYECDELRIAVDAILVAALPAHPLFPTMTPWAAARWERDLGLPVDESKPIQNRVNAILAQLRGFGTATRQRVQAVANTFQNGEVVVIEDYENYVVTFRFVSLLGIPPYLEALQNAVQNIVPAHLLAKWEFVYTTYGMLTGYHQTFAQLTAAGQYYRDLPVYDPT